MRFDKIAVIDFGGQYAHLIATKVRRLNVLCEIKDPQDPLDSFSEYRGIIFSGSPALASDADDAGYDRRIYDLDVPILGLCYGHQEIVSHYGGRVENTQREYGPADLHLIAPSPVLRGLGPVQRVWMSHGDTVTRLPAEFVELAYSTVGAGGGEHRNAAFGCDRLKRYGFQYHPEVDDTVHGQEMLRNFVLDVCGCKPSWTMDNFLETSLEAIRRQVGSRRVLLLASGGIDSTVTAKLLAQALGTGALHLVHIDNGLMRKDESRAVLAELEQLGLGASLHLVDASAEFLKALDGVTEPEEKRHAIGNTFVAVAEREASRLDLEGFVLAQGTIYPDTIETRGTKRADLIKTHHNRVPVIERMIALGRVVEPLSELYKVEVRELARRLGFSDRTLNRHPFPGPGLGIRALCARGPTEGDLSEAEKALAETLRGTDLSGTVLPIRSVGVKADLRCYEHPALLQGPDPGHARLLELATRIYQSVPGVNRCVFALTGGRIEICEVVPATLTRERLDLLREIDAFVMAALDRHGRTDAVWQFPTVLLPLRLNRKGQELVVLRPVLSERGMTARPAELPREMVAEVVAFAGSIPAVSGVVIDLTTKPPGTIEWE